MGMMDAIKKFFGPGEQRMALGQFTIITPLPHIRYMYDLERAIRKLKLNGWLNKTNDGLPTGELEGPLVTIREFFQQVESGKIIPGTNVLETLLPPFRHKYTSFQMKYEQTSNILNSQSPTDAYPSSPPSSTSLPPFKAPPKP